MLLMLAGAAVVALLFAPLRPALAKGPAPKTEIVIQTRQDVGCWAQLGRFKASGAVKDNGSAVTYYGQVYEMELFGRRGDMSILIDDGLFLISDATGDHVHLIGATGTATAIEDITDGYDRNGDCLFGTVQWTLEGSLSP
jgi:hypothetical protein